MLIIPMQISVTSATQSTEGGKSHYVIIGTLSPRYKLLYMMMSSLKTKKSDQQTDIDRFDLIEMSIKKGFIHNNKRQNGLVGRVFANRPGSIPGRVIPKTIKKVLDTSLLNTQQYNVRIKGKVKQSRERSSVLPYTSV